MQGRMASDPQQGIPFGTLYLATPFLKFSIHPSYAKRYGNHVAKCLVAQTLNLVTQVQVLASLSLWFGLEQDVEVSL